MRKIREILRLLWVLRLGVRETARACSSSHSTVLEYQRRALAAELSWEQVEGMDSGILERHLFPIDCERPVRPLPDWVEIYGDPSIVCQAFRKCF